MSSNSIICNGCQTTIRDRRYLLCGGCNGYYDLICANVSEQRFYNTLTKEHRDAWRCVECISKKPKRDNTNTPVRVAVDNITMQRGAAVKSPMELDMSIVEQPLSLTSNLNDTANNVTVEMTDYQSLVIEMRSFKEELREDMRVNREQLKVMTDTLSALIGRVAECENRIDKLNDRLVLLECNTNTDNEPGNKSLAESIKQLKAEINERDQDLLLNDLDISCVPETGGESLPHILKTLASKLGVTISDQDVISTERVGRVLEFQQSDTSKPTQETSTRPRTIVVRLARRAVRDELLRAARVRRGATTEGLHLPGVPRRFYINERLTRVNRMLFRRARELAERLNWRYVWTRGGRIFARQFHGHDCPRFRLKTEEDLERIFGPDPFRSSAIN
ncbi:uncharacterized protein LOC131842809 [Achroia grisella]|uniref:uncharacterized protein LOC131842809 n=1 Tax=Achroia grisella TaxID=688607 RepID=UPI0027D2353B|nr:uncharacterized protein LOC131842809 [Achroia grisella]